METALYSALALLGAISAHAMMSNPYNRLGHVREPYSSHTRDGITTLEKKKRFVVRRSLPYKALAYAKCGWHILINVYLGGKKTPSRLYKDIARDIHALRFNPEVPYLITGDHFSVLYPRNLGTFYHAVLDPRTAHDAENWRAREHIYLKTAAYALEAFAAHGECATTIVPMGGPVITCLNIYHYPSDALYGLLYALAALSDNSFMRERYPYVTRQPIFAQTTRLTAQALTARHARTLEKLFASYRTHVYDPATGLVRRGIRLSSAKDSARRESAFYDNVIFWATCSLAGTLGIAHDPLDLDALKDRIIAAFWDEKAGHFIDDLSSASRRDAHYSADWLCTLYTGFLHAGNPQDLVYLQTCADTTLARNLDMPFPLKYQESDRRMHQVSLTALMVPSYGGTAIWSFWGAEFMKLLLILAQCTGDKKYLDRARQHVHTYKDLVERHRGFPEVFRANGKMLRNPVYKSVRQTGWIVGFEQTTAMLESIDHAAGNVLE
jgi:hypothetical protein